MPEMKYSNKGQILAQEITISRIQEETKEIKLLASQDLLQEPTANQEVILLQEHTANQEAVLQEVTALQVPEGIQVLEVQDHPVEEAMAAVAVVQEEDNIPFPKSFNKRLGICIVQPINKTS